MEKRSTHEKWERKMNEDLFIRAKTKSGQEVLVDRRKPDFATQIELKIVGGAPVLEFFCLDVLSKEGEQSDVEIDLEEGSVEPIARIALSPTALESLEEIMLEIFGTEEEGSCGCGQNH
ncbi:MAG TPA: hypothetical protein DD435_15200 [Cyanobacteria bacterium UBA8530]|nr:hypothetical protein [Cyanobacteria bacterium UBA8530]